ncbi:MAG: GNAT family N-acetyltransferase [Vicinamibacteria bacterium]|jgi:GNAT superfamily N-acetyltransferase|nr:GNAT family N-acetyltransferase [Vicinamibacteria bacterium]MBP9944860.1 GNAT family N-acetyltransferase [Vicinamibacteria bacterium]
MSATNDLSLSLATEQDLPQILTFIKALAEYERLADAVVATEEGLRESLFGARPYAECIIARFEGKPAGFALFFHNFSTFLGRPGIYLEDLFVNPELRGKGIGRALLQRLAQLALERHCGRLEWSVLDWNESAIGFYKSIGAVSLDEWTIFRLRGDGLKQLAGGDYPTKR